MRDLGRLLLFAGIAIAIGGLLLMLWGRLGIGRLPGDFVFRRGNVTIYVPIVTSILLSIVLSLLFWLFRR